MADSYIDRKGERYFSEACFGSLNSYDEKFSIIIEKYKLGYHDDNFNRKFFNYIRHLSILPFTKTKFIPEESDDEVEEGVLLVFNETGYRSTYLKYTYTVIRCLYEDEEEDECFQRVAERYVELCDLFTKKEADRTSLLCIAINLMLIEAEDVYFRDIHFFCSRELIKIVNTKQLNLLLDRNESLQDCFEEGGITAEIEELLIIENPITKENINKILKLSNNV